MIPAIDSWGWGGFLTKLDTNYSTTKRFTFIKMKGHSLFQWMIMEKY